MVRIRRSVSARRVISAVVRARAAPMALATSAWTRDVGLAVEESAQFRRQGLGRSSHHIEEPGIEPFPFQHLMDRVDRLVVDLLDELTDMGGDLRCRSR